MSTDDIVTRIREQANAGYISDDIVIRLHDLNATWDFGLLEDAAREISRLREENKILRDALRASTNSNTVYFKDSSYRTTSLEPVYGLHEFKEDKTP